MLAPVNELTWVHDLNNLQNSGDRNVDTSAMLYGIKAALVAAGWTVSMSSDRTSYGAADYWLSAADVKWVANAPGSWIVLRNTALASGTFEIMLGTYWYTGNTPDVVCYCSPNAFTGGNLTTFPTATPSIGLQTNQTTTGMLYSTLTAKYWHVSVSTNRKSTRFFITASGKCVMFACFEDLKNPPANIAAADNWFAFYYTGGSSATDKPTLANMREASTWGKGYLTGSSLALATYLASEGCGAGSLASAVTMPNAEDNTTWPIYPIKVVGYNVAVSYVERGELRDIWYAPDALITGATHPASGAKTHVKMGALLLPWDGSVPSIT